ncbi:MAG TPA: EamA family transporter [Candidatus Saccharimonadales bacterium]|nr:EamA family transporter [Candidatus Saccharimonadales bacterium]
MQRELLVAVLAGIGGMIGWGSADFFAKKTVDRVGSIVSLVWAHFFGTYILILIAISQLVFFHKAFHFPSSPPQWVGLIFFGVLQMIVYWLVYEGFGKGQLAVLNPVFASFTGVVALISILFLGESGGFAKFFPLGVIFLGIMLISLDTKALFSLRLKLDNIPGLKEVGIATVLASFWTLGWSKFIARQDWVSYALFMYLFMTIAAFVFSKLMKVKIGAVKSDLWKFLILIGFGEVIAYLAISLGYSATSLVSIVALISGAFSLPTILLARIFLKERVNLDQTIGTLVIIFGIIALSVLNK